MLRSASVLLRVSLVSRLPFLNGVRAFEAAARLGSFTAAGEELNVTPAAISRMVRLLEERMGVALFERTANRLLLTDAGEAYSAGLTPLLDSLSRLTARVEAMTGSRVLTIGVGPTFATRWLIPRLTEFQKIAPDIELRLATGGAAAPFADDWTCGIEQGNRHPPGLIAEPMIAASLSPVCTPGFARQLKSPRSLKPAMLLRVAHAAKDWQRWIEHAGVPALTPRGAEFEFYGQALQAAADGLGIAMGIRPYVDDDLAAGRLVMPFSATIASGRSWHLVYRPDRREDPVFVQFRAWLLEAAGQAD